MCHLKTVFLIIYLLYKNLYFYLEQMEQYKRIIEEEYKKIKNYGSWTAIFVGNLAAQRPHADYGQGGQDTAG